MKQYILIFLSLICVPSWAATAPDVAAYVVPLDAVKRGPMPSPDPNVRIYTYYLPGTSTWYTNVIAYETFVGGVLTEREMKKNGTWHGIWRKWYETGQIKSEAPYKEGLMDGTFKNWNEKGQLTAQYEMVGGAGVRTTYYDNGHLQAQESLKNNERDGLTVMLHDNGQVGFICRFSKDYSTGMAASFYDDGALNYVAWRGGPSIDFAHERGPEVKKWHFQGKEVDEKIYATAAAKDPALPPYYTDSAEYAKLVETEFGTLLKQYNNIPPVKIPLEFDEQGQPLPASPIPATP